MASSNSIFIPGLRIFVSQFNVNIHETLLDATYWLTKMKLHLFLKYFFEEFLPLLMWKDWVGPTEWKKPLALSVWFPCQKMARQGAQGGRGGLFSCITFKASAFQGFIWRHHSSCWQWRCMVLSDFQKVTPEISRAFCLAVKLWGGRLVECMWKAWIDLRLWGDLNPCPVKVVWEDGGSLTSGTRGHKRGDRMFCLICLFVWPC